MPEKTIDLFAGYDNPTQEQQEQYNCFIERFGKEPPVHFTYQELYPDGTVSIVNKWYMASDKLQVVGYASYDQDTVFIFIDLFTFDRKELFIKYIDDNKQELIPYDVHFAKSALCTVWNIDDNEIPSVFIEIISASERFKVW